MEPSPGPRRLLMTWHPSLSNGGAQLPKEPASDMTAQGLTRGRGQFVCPYLRSYASISLVRESAVPEGMGKDYEVPGTHAKSARRLLLGLISRFSRREGLAHPPRIRVQRLTEAAHTLPRNQAPPGIGLEFTPFDDDEVFIVGFGKLDEV